LFSTEVEYFVQIYLRLGHVFILDALASYKSTDAREEENIVENTSSTTGGFPKK
jgi:hypothetical protein